MANGTDMDYFKIWSLKTSHPQSFMLFPPLQAVRADMHNDLGEPRVEDGRATRWKGALVPESPLREESSTDQEHLF